MAGYKEELTNRYWTYRKTFFAQNEDDFERQFAPGGRPPVFHKRAEWKNVIVKPNANQDEVSRLLSLLPEGERHKWFRSMNSSQALAQSVLGNLAVYNHLSCLAELTDDANEPLFGQAQVSPENFAMEHKIHHLGEPRCTSLDGVISGTYQVAVECKFTESEIGSCSRPSLSPTDSNYTTDFCNGTFAVQRGRRERCSLTEVGVLYWKYIPALFRWPNDTDLTPCPLHRNYQLVRNVLAICARPDGSVSPDNGHAVLIYDERNPAFQAGGDGFTTFEETRKAIKVPGLLRKCSWQRIVNHLRHKAILPWLTTHLELKYGL